MGWTDRRARWRSTAARAALLVAVLAGLFGMHVLTAEDGATGHGALPMVGIAGHDGGTGKDPTMAAAVPVVEVGAGPIWSSPTVALGPSDPGSGADHGAMAACILFLVIGGAVLLLALLRHRHLLGSFGTGGRVGTVLTDMRRRGPPLGWPRLALCVIRV